MKKSLEFKEESSIINLVNLLFSNITDYSYVLELIDEIGDLGDEERLELEKAIITLYYENNNEEYRMNFETNIQYLSNKEKNRKILGIISRYFDKTKFFDNIYTKRFNVVNFDIQKIETESKRLKKLYKKIDKEMKSYKLDLIGIISGVLSIFTIFGINYNFIDRFLSINNVNDKRFVFIWILLNATVLLVIRLLFYAIKEFFYFKNDEFKKNDCEIENNKLNKGFLNVEVFEFQNIFLVVVIILMLLIIS